MTATASQRTGTSSRSGRRACSSASARRRPIHSIRASRYASSGYTSGTETSIRAALKNAVDAENALSASRSTCSIPHGRRRNGTTNSTASGIHTHGALTIRPNAPG